VRTTLDIDDDVLQAAKEIAASRRATAGQVLSELARKALAPSRAARLRNGVPVLPRRPVRCPALHHEAVNELRDA